MDNAAAARPRAWPAWGVAIINLLDWAGRALDVMELESLAEKASLSGVLAFVTSDAVTTMAFLWLAYLVFAPKDWRMRLIAWWKGGPIELNIGPLRHGRLTTGTNAKRRNLVAASKFAPKATTIAEPPEKRPAAPRPQLQSEGLSEIDKIRREIQNLASLAHSNRWSEFNRDETDDNVAEQRIDIAWDALRARLEPIIDPVAFKTLPVNASESLGSFQDTLSYVRTALNSAISNRSESRATPESRSIATPARARKQRLPNFAALRWEKQERGSQLLMELVNHAGYTQSITLICMDMEFWNGTAFASALDAEQHLFLIETKPKGLAGAEQVILIKENGSEFQVNSMLGPPIRHSAVGLWRLTLKVRSDGGLTGPIGVCFYWNPKKQDKLRYVECQQ